MSWSLRQSSWLRRRVLVEDSAELVALWPYVQKPVGVLTLTSGGRITLWRHTRGGAESTSWGQAPLRARAMVGHDPSHRLALVGAFGLQVWSMKSREKDGEIGSELGAIDCAAFSHDGALFTGGRDGCWRRWPAEVVGRASLSNVDSVVPAHEKPIRALAAHPHGECLVSAGGDHVLRVWEI